MNEKNCVLKDIARVASSYFFKIINKKESKNLIIVYYEMHFVTGGNY